MDSTLGTGWWMSVHRIDVAEADGMRQQHQTRWAIGRGRTDVEQGVQARGSRSSGRDDDEASGREGAPGELAGNFQPKQAIQGSGKGTMLDAGRVPRGQRLGVSGRSPAALSR